jgi:predicted RNase H-like HicB family nuclease
VGLQMMNDYHINIFYSAEDEAYIADIPDLKYGSAHGETPQAALAEVLMAKEAWIEAAEVEGRVIPTPRYRPAIYQVG